ncbi:hypothetical protein [Pontibacillus sp. HN14]|uniref:hypothetical protein n=1 Tax=Pontibacillus sp. HN14 TaxID=2898421 RepID=UPI001E572D40|nr:hypothetical protein [Pontibacillus sp. HN14]
MIDTVEKWNNFNDLFSVVGGDVIRVVGDLDFKDVDFKPLTIRALDEGDVELLGPVQGETGSKGTLRNINVFSFRRTGFFYVVKGNLTSIRNVEILDFSFNVNSDFVFLMRQKGNINGSPKGEVEVKHTELDDVEFRGVIDVGDKAFKMETGYYYFNEDGEEEYKQFKFKNIKESEFDMKLFGKRGYFSTEEGSYNNTYVMYMRGDRFVFMNKSVNDIDCNRDYLNLDIVCKDGGFGAIKLVNSEVYGYIDSDSLSGNNMMFHSPYNSLFDIEFLKMSGGSDFAYRPKNCVFNISKSEFLYKDYSFHANDKTVEIVKPFGERLDNNCFYYIGSEIKITDETGVVYEGLLTEKDSYYNDRAINLATYRDEEFYKRVVGWNIYNVNSREKV